MSLKESFISILNQGDEATNGLWKIPPPLLTLKSLEASCVFEGEIYKENSKFVAKKKYIILSGKNIYFQNVGYDSYKVKKIS